jgi:hypothetical protein
MMKFGFLAVAAAGLLLGSALPVAAQAPSCAIADEGLATHALGTVVHVQGIPTSVPGLDACDVVDTTGNAITVSRQSDAFTTVSLTGAVGLAAVFIPDLPDAAQAQLAVLSQTGIKLTVPGFELSSVNGVGDAALWVKTDGGDSLLAQRGTDAFAFETDDAPDAQMKLTALARAVLTSP